MRMGLMRRFLQIWLLLRQNCPLYRTDLETDTTIDTGIKVNPIPVCSLLIFTWAFVNTGDRAGVYAVSDAFANVSHNRVGHSG